MSRERIVSSVPEAIVRVKFLSRLPHDEWLRYFPREDGVWGCCAFNFDRSARSYDWLVALDDIPPAEDQGSGAARTGAREMLACPRAQTLLITTEPPSIKAYGRSFAAQFGHVLTSQPAWALPHANRHFQQAANRWFYGSAPGRWMSRRQLLRGPDRKDKTRDISVVHSAKRQWHTMHARRFRFIEQMRERLPDMAVFGRGTTPIADKAEALDGFRYHLAVENHNARHHFTEKLSDAFLGRCLPFYSGCVNAEEYFPEGSFIPIDMRDPEGAAELIRRSVRDRAWEERQSLIEEARRRVLEQYHLFAVIDRIIREVSKASDGNTPSAPMDDDPSPEILSRHAWRRAHRIGAVMHAGEKLCVRACSLAGRR